MPPYPKGKTLKALHTSAMAVTYATRHDHKKTSEHDTCPLKILTPKWQAGTLTKLKQFKTL
jgi:hypothetical protein